jgi:cryptochrome
MSATASSAAPLASRSIYIFRKALRLHDNESLLSAVAGATVLFPVFILDPHFCRPATLHANRFNFLLESLADLDASLRALGSRLFVVRGAPATVLPTLLTEWRVGRVTWEDDTEPYAQERDAVLSALCAARGVASTAVHGHTLWAPAALAARAGGAARVPSSYESFLKLAASLPPPPKPFPRPTALPPAAACGVSEGMHGLPTLAACGYDPAAVTTFFRGGGGETAALARLRARVETRQDWVRHFSKPHTNPTALAPDTTGLSPHLKFGCLGARTFYWALEGVPGKATAPPVSLTGQLLWRDFFYAQAWAAGRNFGVMVGNPLCRQVAWGYDAALLEAWERGRTGYPWIDACMAQLRRDGWLHHLGRHAVACFLTRGDLWQSWEHGARIFDKYLVDSDWALNNGNWMWLSCSAFYYQYFKVYSPVSFAKKLDPNGDYIRKFLPQFKDFPAKFIYEPWEAPLAVQRAHGVEVGVGYPARVVIHDTASRANKERMAQAYEAHKEGRGAEQAAAAAHLAKGAGAAQVGGAAAGSRAWKDAPAEGGGGDEGGGGGGGGASSSSSSGSSSAVAAAAPALPAAGGGKRRRQESLEEALARQGGAAKK